MKKYIFLLYILVAPQLFTAQENKKTMLYADETRKVNPYASDAHILEYKNHYFLYYTAPPIYDNMKLVKGWRIGIAKSSDMENWRKVGEVIPTEWYEQRGISAPCVFKVKDKIHMVYQTYGNEDYNVILHAVSENAVEFEKDENSPVFVAKGDWNTGRSTDADVVPSKHRYRLYFSTRDKETGNDVIAVASAPLVTTFSRREWVMEIDSAILTPKYPWEGNSLTSPSVIEHNGLFYMFYAGAKSNAPQQIGVASSRDGLTWTRLSNKPFLVNGDPDQWNSMESGNPHIFRNSDGRTFLFFQGNNDGLSSLISKVEIGWNDKGPYIMP